MPTLWFVACSAVCHYLNWCWNIVNWALGNKLQWNCNQNRNFIKKMHLKMSPANWREFCSDLNVLSYQCSASHPPHSLIMVSQHLDPASCTIWLESVFYPNTLYLKTLMPPHRCDIFNHEGNHSMLCAGGGAGSSRETGRIWGVSTLTAVSQNALMHSYLNNMADIFQRTFKRHFLQWKSLYFGYFFYWDPKGSIGKSRYWLS